MLLLFFSLLVPFFLRKLLQSVELIKQEENSNARGRVQQTPTINTCWNCGKASHSIRECQYTVNAITVEWNRELQYISKNLQMKQYQKGYVRS